MDARPEALTPETIQAIQLAASGTFYFKIPPNDNFFRPFLIVQFVLHSLGALFVILGLLQRWRANGAWIVRRRKVIDGWFIQINMTLWWYGASLIYIFLMFGYLFAWKRASSDGTSLQGLHVWMALPWGLLFILIWITAWATSTQVTLTIPAPQHVLKRHSILFNAFFIGVPFLFLVGFAIILILNVINWNKTYANYLQIEGILSNMEEFDTMTMINVLLILKREIEGLQLMATYWRLSNIFIGSFMIATSILLSVVATINIRQVKSRFGDIIDFNQEHSEPSMSNTFLRYTEASLVIVAVMLTIMGISFAITGFVVVFSPSSMTSTSAIKIFGVLGPPSSYMIFGNVVTITMLLRDYHTYTRQTPSTLLDVSVHPELSVKEPESPGIICPFLVKSLQLKRSRHDPTTPVRSCFI